MNSHQVIDMFHMTLPFLHRVRIVVDLTRRLQAQALPSSCQNDHASHAGRDEFR